MVTQNEEEPTIAPLLVRLVAGIDYLIMFGVALVGGLVANFGLVANELLAELYTLDPIAYAELILVLLNLHIPPPLFGTIMTAVGLTFAFVGFLGMIVAIGTAYRKSWAVPLGVVISVVSIIGSILAYFFGGPILPFLTGSLILFAIVLQLLVVILMVNVFFTGAFLLWQLNELGGSYTQIGRFVLIWNLDMLCLIFTDLIVPGIDIIPSTFLTYFGVAYIIVVIISLLNLIVRPIFTRIITQIARLSLGFAISFILILVLNAGILLLIPLFISDFLVIGLPSAFLGSLVLSITNTIFISIIGLDDDTSFFQNIVRQQLLAKAEANEVPKTKGLLAIEIDGLSHEAIRKALRRGYMPTVQKLIRSRSHRLIKWDCGVPSMTSSCQAGIMYGDNKDIPAFRWYRKREGSMVVSNNPGDAKYIDQSHSSGKGLLRGGSSVGNLISGDASYSFFTMSTLTVQDSKAGKRRSENLYYYLVKPYVLMRSLIYTLWDVLVELGQIFKQGLVRRKPRMGRLHGGYPIVRASTNVFMRDIATAMVCQNLLRGLPAIYVTYLGYDEIAHHSGPLTTDALKALVGIDKQIRRCLKVIEQYAPRPYELILLADHGQSVGWTFKQRYGKSLKDTIRDLLVGKAQVGEVEAFDAHRGYVNALVSDLNEGRRRVGGKGGRDRIIRGSSSFLGKQASKGYKEPEVKADDVIVCASGNLAHIYFTYKKGKVTLQDLEAKYPGFVTNLVAHKGVGFAIVWDKEKGPVLLGTRGAVLLRSGKVHGSNPLHRYGRVNVRVKQLLRLAEFPSCGGIILISPIYQDGSVAAYEELVGSHGGLGGPQTEPFLLHPAKIKVNGDNIINSEQIYKILNRRRSAQ